MTQAEYNAWKAQLDLAEPMELLELRRRIEEWAEEVFDPLVQSLRIYANEKCGRQSGYTSRRRRY